MLVAAGNPVKTQSDEFIMELSNLCTAPIMTALMEVTRGLNDILK